MHLTLTPSDFCSETSSLIPSWNCSYVDLYRHFKFIKYLKLMEKETNKFSPCNFYITSIYIIYKVIKSLKMYALKWHMANFFPDTLQSNHSSLRNTGPLLFLHPLSLHSRILQIRLDNLIKKARVQNLQMRTFRFISPKVVRKAALFKWCSTVMIRYLSSLKDDILFIYNKYKCIWLS